MDGCHPRFQPRLWLLGLVAAALSAAGCTQALFTAMYLVKGTDVEPEFAGLKKKDVVIVCRPLVNLQYQDSRVAKDLAVALGRILREKGKVKVVDQRKVERWIDENTWEQFADVGKALDAEMVLGIDLEYFNLYQGQTLYQGKANITLQVVDLDKGAKKHKEQKKDAKGQKDDQRDDKNKDFDEEAVAFEKSMQIVFPLNSCVPTSDKPPAQFRRDFIAAMAERVSRNFCDHDPHGDIGADANYGL